MKTDIQKTLRLIGLLMVLPLCSLKSVENSRETEFYVSPDGSDSQNGKSIQEAFASLEKARDQIRELKHAGPLSSPVTVYLLGGTYNLSEPFELNVEDSGSEMFPITYRAFKNEKPVISGGIEVRTWTEAELNGYRVLVADISKLSNKNKAFEQLWVNGHRAVQARTPNTGYFRMRFEELEEQGPNTKKESMRGLPYLQKDEHYFDGVMDGVAVTVYKWLNYHLPIDRVDRENKQIVFKNKGMRQIVTNESYYLEGGRTMLDREGEWYFDRENDKLYYFPLKGETDVVATIPSLESVLNVKGDAATGKWVERIAFHCLTFSYTTHVLPRESGPSSLGQADIRGVGGAVVLKDVKNCLLEACKITGIGNYGLEIGTGCSNNRILGCEISDMGAGGILVGAKIRPPSPKEGYAPGEFVPPVLEHEYDITNGNEIADCRIHDGGRYFHSAVGIWIGQSPNNHIHHNEIFNFYYSGISSGWTWGYGPGLATGNRFEYNHIHHIGRLKNGDGSILSDLGGIYTLGDQTGTIICNNVFHDIGAGKYGGWAIYCDEGTRNILIENNLAYRCRHACFDQHYGKNNLLRNNIFAFADTSVVMLAKAEEHLGFTLQNNILLSDGTPIYAGGYKYTVDMPGRFNSDKNLIWSTAGEVIGAQDRFPSRLYEPSEPVLSWDQWLELGNDRNSIVADPGFEDPENGNFSLPDDSPALKIGFKPFPLDKSGPRKSI